MNSYNSSLLNRFEIAENTLACRLLRPRTFLFKAGQYINLTLLGPGNGQPNRLTHTFSIASPPFEPYIVLITRIRNSRFKEALKRVPLGTPMRIDGPMGSLTLHKNPTRPAVFLAGGIGIAPFYSMLGQATKEQLGHKLFLFYANRREEDAGYLQAIWNLTKANPNVRFVPTLTRVLKPDDTWTGETGYISREMLERHIGSLHGPLYYIAGPPTMVSTINQMLIAADVDPADIRTEEFVGY